MCARPSLATLILVSPMIGTGCAAGQPELADTESASTVDDYTAAGCSTAVVIGLAKQIAQQANCEHPGDFVPLAQTSGIRFASNAVLPYLEMTARDDLQQVTSGGALIVTSGMRTLAQQYLLVRWHQANLCGIAAAAAVGTSNHEGGRAVDLMNWSDLISAMSADGWMHDVPGDDVHFDHTASPDNRGEDIHAFQVLWNLNHPMDQIAVDGNYGPRTEARLRASPATGFALGPTCSTPPTSGADVVSVIGPDHVVAQMASHFTIVVKNTSHSDWPATSEMQVASGTPSPLYDASWISQTVVTTIAAPVASGELATIDFDIMAPAVTTATPVSETLAFAHGATAFGTIDFEVTVLPDMSAGSGSGSGSDGDGDQMQGDATGTPSKDGCNVASRGGAGWLAFVLAAPIVRRRRVTRPRNAGSPGGS